MIRRAAHSGEGGGSRHPSRANERGEWWHEVRNPLDVATYVMKGPLLSLGLPDNQALRLLEFRRDLSAGSWMWITEGFWRDEADQAATVAEPVRSAEKLVPEILERAAGVGPARCLPSAVLSFVRDGRSS